jgi:6-pyruvoyltetrahydropterin/6-carboxytetrahydropterin synthase
MIITKIFTFDAAHKLVDYDGPCAKLHGHTYILHISLKGEINKTGLVMDFKDLKRIVNDEILSHLDHSFLNDVIAQPTAENIAMWILGKLKHKLPLYKILLYETPDSYVTLKVKDYETK